MRSHEPASSPTSAASPVDGVDIAITALVGRANAPLSTKFVSAMFAGALIGLGFIFFVTTQVGAAELPWGVARALGGLAFCGGLFVVIMLGADLFTSTTMTTLLLAERRLAPGPWALHWVVIFLGNMLGAGLLAWLVSVAGTANLAEGEWGATVIRAALGKVEHGVGEAIALGVLCNVLVCLAVWVAFLGRTVVDKFVAVLFPIPLFVATGFEHSVANMFLLPLALVLRDAGDPAVMSALGADSTEALTWGSYLLANLAPVAVGNIIGGSIVALGIWVWHWPARVSGQRKRRAAEADAPLGEIDG